eukprot:Rhum_TRINITY_DN14422_c7_g3::Rhum_TRINITY_DN14422_c7_g3_i1::g.88074::m.88074
MDVEISVRKCTRGGRRGCLQFNIFTDAADGGGAGCISRSLGTTPCTGAPLPPADGDNASFDALLVNRSPRLTPLALPLDRRRTLSYTFAAGRRNTRLPSTADPMWTAPPPPPATDVSSPAKMPRRHCETCAAAGTQNRRAPRATTSAAVSVSVTYSTYGSWMGRRCLGWSPSACVTPTNSGGAEGAAAAASSPSAASSSVGRAGGDRGGVAGAGHTRSSADSIAGVSVAAACCGKMCSSVPSRASSRKRGDDAAAADPPGGGAGAGAAAAAAAFRYASTKDATLVPLRCCRPTTTRPRGLLSALKGITIISP